MGNRAVITLSTKKTSGVGAYLHWNGGLESILAFLKVCEMRKYRDPYTDPSYALARLIGVLHEFFDGSDSLGVGPLKELDTSNYDNGTYVLDSTAPGWHIAKRWGAGSEPKRLTLAQLSEAERKQYEAIIKNLQLTKE